MSTQCLMCTSCGNNSNCPICPICDEDINGITTEDSVSVHPSANTAGSVVAANSTSIPHSPPSANTIATKNVSANLPTSLSPTYQAYLLPYIKNAPAPSPAIPVFYDLSPNKSMITIPQLVILIFILFLMIGIIVYLYRKYKASRQLQQQQPIVPTRSYNPFQSPQNVQPAAYGGKKRSGNKKWKAQGGCGCNATNPIV